jgi:hypothetical protein
MKIMLIVLLVGSFIFTVMRDPIVLYFLCGVTMLIISVYMALSYALLKQFESFRSKKDMEIESNWMP